MNTANECETLHLQATDGFEKWELWLELLGLWDPKVATNLNRQVVADFIISLPNCSFNESI
jgi:hypothetical protein